MLVLDGIMRWIFFVFTGMTLVKRGYKRTNKQKWRFNNSDEALQLLIIGVASPKHPTMREKTETRCCSASYRAPLPIHLPRPAKIYRDPSEKDREQALQRLMANFCALETTRI